MTTEKLIILCNEARELARKLGTRLAAFFLKAQGVALNIALIVLARIPLNVAAA